MKRVFKVVVMTMAIALCSCDNDNTDECLEALLKHQKQVELADGNEDRIDALNHEFEIVMERLNCY